MYNGIGLDTTRGSGTNGYVQRNFAFVPKSKNKVSYRTERDLTKLDAQANRQGNVDILHHEKKRKIEVKCVMYQDDLEAKG